MTEAVKFLIIGFVMLVLGILFFTKRESWARQMAEQTRQYREVFKFNYSERYFHLSYIFGGLFCSLTEIVLILKSIADLQQGIWKEISNTAIVLFTIAAFGGGLIFIIFANLKFSRIWKRNRK